MTKPIPDGFHTLTPHIVVTDGVQAIEFYKKAFGAHEEERHLTPDGKAVMHARLKIGNSMLMLAGEFPLLRFHPKAAAARASICTFTPRTPTPRLTVPSKPVARSTCRSPTPFGATATARWKIRSATNGPSPRTNTTTRRSSLPPTPRNSLPRCRSVDAAGRAPNN